MKNFQNSCARARITVVYFVAMQTLRACACALLCSCLVSLSSAQVSKSWSAYRDMNHYGNEMAGSIAPSSDGGYFEISADKTNSILRKIDTSGAVLWKRGIPGARIATNTALLSNGTGVVIVTSVLTSGVSWIMASKFDTTGHQLWTSRLSPKLYTGMGQAIFDPSGNIVISGGAEGPGYSEGLLAKLNASTGAVMFQTSYGTPNLSDSIDQIKTDSAGNIFAAASSADLTQASYPPPTLHLLKYSPTGSLLWSQDFAETAGRSLAVDPSGNSYLITSDNATYSSSAILKFNPNGTALWTKSLGGFSSTVSSAFAPNGNLVFAMYNAETTFALRQITPAGSITDIATTAGQLANPTSGMAFDGSGNLYFCALIKSGNDFPRPVLHKFNLSTGLVWSRIEVGSFGTNNLGSNPSSVIIDGAGHAIYLSTVSNVVPTVLDTRISSYDSAGNKLWSDDNDPQMTGDHAAASVTDSSGNTYVVDYDANCKLTKFDANGQYAWAHTLMDLAPDGAFPPEISTNGNVVVPVRYTKFSGEIGALFYYNPAGSLLWKYSLTSSNDLLREFHVANDGSIYLALEHFANGLGNLRLVHLSTSGAVLWTSNEVAIPQRHVFNMVVDGSGSTFVTYGSHAANLILAKFNSAGVPQWRKQIMGSEFGYSSRLKLDPAGNILMLAGRQMAYTDMVIKVNPNANILWSRPISIHGASNELAAFAVDNLGNTFVAGYDNANTRVQKVSPSGAISWTADYAWPGFPGFWINMIPDQSGGVFVARNIDTKNGSDYQLYKLAADGTLPWPASGGIFANGSIRYDSRGLDDIACQLTRDGLGNLFITGTSYGASGTQDVNVVKYALQP